MKRITVSIFVLFHLLAISIWCVPLDSPLIVDFRNAVRPYFVWAGLFQSWDTFAPEPRSINSYVEAAVIDKDGHIHTWKFPRMEHLSLTERYASERYRKFTENLQEEKNRALWPDVARHVAWLNRDPANPPEIVMLIRYWSEISPGAPVTPGSAPKHGQIFYEYNVKPADLK